MAEQCENCGRDIGAIETAFLVEDHVVCGDCRDRVLRSRAPVPTLSYATPPQPPTYHGPSPHYDFERAEKRRRRDEKIRTQRVGCALFLAGILICCVFWPIGLPMAILGVVIALLYMPLK